MKPIIFLAFANDKADYTRYLRNLGKEQETIEDLLTTIEKQGFCEVKTVYNATFKKIADVFQDKRFRDRIAVFHFGGYGDQDILQLETSDGGKALVEAGGFSNFLASQQNLKLWLAIPKINLFFDALIAPPYVFFVRLFVPKVQLLLANRAYTYSQKVACFHLIPNI